MMEVLECFIDFHECFAIAGTEDLLSLLALEVECCHSFTTLDILRTLTSASAGVATTIDRRAPTISKALRIARVILLQLRVKLVLLHRHVVVQVLTTHLQRAEVLAKVLPRVVNALFHALEEHVATFCSRYDELLIWSPDIGSVFVVEFLSSLR